MTPEVMTEVMFELQEIDPKGKFTVTEGVVKGEAPLFEKKAAPDKKSA